VKFKDNGYNWIQLPLNAERQSEFLGATPEKWFSPSDITSKAVNRRFHREEHDWVVGASSSLLPEGFSGRTLRRLLNPRKNKAPASPPLGGRLVFFAMQN